MSRSAPIALAALLSAAPISCLAAQDEFTELFAVTCVANVFSPEKLRETLTTPLTSQLPPDRAAAFLGGRSGVAWEVLYGKGQYAVALAESGFCAVFARHAPIKAVTDGFVGLVATAPSPLDVRVVGGEQAGPNDDDLTSTSYVWFRPGESLDIVFTLTTSKAARDPEIQAMASVALARPEP